MYPRFQVLEHGAAGAGPTALGAHCIVNLQVSHEWNHYYNRIMAERQDHAGSVMRAPQAAG